MDFLRHYPFTLDWAWTVLPADQLWDCITYLPEDSSFHRLAGTSSPLEENVATLLDFVVHQVIGDHRRHTFDPEKFDEHRELEREYKRSDTPPPAVPSVTPVALRPEGWASLTGALTAVPEPHIDEVEGHDAHVRLAAFIDSLP